MTEATAMQPTQQTAQRAQGLPIWYELMTPDPAGVAPFYHATLGWEIPAEGHDMPNGSQYREIRRADGGHAGGVLTLTQGMASGGAKPAWFPYFHVEDVDRSVEAAAAKGAQVCMAPMTMEGVGRMAMIADPQGATFYVMDPTPPPDKPDMQSDVFKAMVPGHCWWNELETSDEPGATAFYTELFGWSAENTMPMGDKGVYRFVEVGGEQIGAINPWLADYMIIGWLPYFGVADIEAAKAAAQENGATITHDIDEVPGGSFVFTATDPAGAPLGFVGPKGA